MVVLMMRENDGASFVILCVGMEQFPMESLLLFFFLQRIAG